MRLAVSLLFLSILAFAQPMQKRCENYLQEIRVSHEYVFGIGFPYWFGLGQIIQESNCRNVISRDGVGSQGLPQITFRVWQKYLKSKGIDNIIPTTNQLHAQAWIMKNCKKQAYSSHLWVAYQIYNGGPLVNREIKRARKALGIREVPHDVARRFCKRKVVHFNNGQSINACDINYDYSKKIYKYGIKYKLFNTRYIFW